LFGQVRFELAGVVGAGAGLNPMCVCAQRDGDVGVPELAADRGDVDARRDEVIRRSVAQVMNADAPEFGAVTAAEPGTGFLTTTRTPHRHLASARFLTGLGARIRAPE